MRSHFSVLESTRQFWIQALETGENKEPASTREEVMRNIGDFIFSGFHLGINPLPMVRKMFPYKWTWFDLDDDVSNLANFAQITVATADFIWLPPGPCVVTAIVKEGKPRFPSPFVWSHKDARIHTMESLRAAGATLLPIPKPRRVEVAHPMSHRLPLHPEANAPPKPYNVGDWVVAKSVPTETPHYYISMGKGVVNDKEARRVEKIWWLHDRWLITLVGVGGMFDAPQFIKD